MEVLPDFKLVASVSLWWTKVFKHTLPHIAIVSLVLLVLQEDTFVTASPTITDQCYCISCSCEGFLTSALSAFSACIDCTS